MFSVAIVATLSLWGSWASAQSAYEDDVDADDAAFLVEVEADEAVEDVDAYNLALRDVATAPAFCAVVLVEPDATHGWRAVCELVTDETDGYELTDSAGDVVFAVRGGVL